MKKLVLLTFAGLLGYSIYSYNLNVAKNDEYYKETMSEIEAAFDRAKSQPENDSIVESEVEVSGGGGPEKVYSEEAKEYFREITLKTEFDGDRKNAFVWMTDIKIFVDGQKREYLMNELRKIVAELNVIIDPINVKIVSNKSESNYIVYFGSHTDFKTKYKLSSPQHLDNNWGYFEVSTNSGKMYVDLVRNGDVESYKHLLREELTQSLGLFNDSWDYPESIFYQGWTTTTEYAPIDRELIDMLYNN
jgi:hypothetical protein